VEALPKILLTAMRRPRIAVMVARGDLGVEIGFESPHILLALDFLCDVLARMKGHRTKKSALMRKLSVAEMALT